MKIIALTALGVVCVLTGQYIAYRLNMHVRLLEEIRLMFGIIESDIQFLCRPADEIISMLSAKEELSDLKFLAICDSQMKNGIDFKNAWENALKMRQNTAYLCKDDVEMLVSFGGLFGISDSCGQISNCRMHSELVKDKLNYARERRDRYASLSCGLGIISGIGVIIIFF